MQEFVYLTVAQLFTSVCQKKEHQGGWESRDSMASGAQGREKMYLEIIYLVLW